MCGGSRWSTRVFPVLVGEFESGGRENGNGSGKWKRERWAFASGLYQFPFFLNKEYERKMVGDTKHE